MGPPSGILPGELPARINHITMIRIINVIRACPEGAARGIL